ncbi:hypothetical protein AVDCRST_MAG84-4769 [uncultured Microcoleus sp.]|uniref:Uncharacterized protein n=1 Tax=uncultured Microcoleus sp. TaxID=259945 RepID=A0A6J4N340_9CYAN|nr:hypothetical protein AVDCRST_MAG84-4769 [uncultured Microcoleus sp.]
MAASNGTIERESEFRSSINMTETGFPAASSPECASLLSRNPVS